MADLAALQVSLDLQTAAFERGMASATASMARLEANSKKTSTGIEKLAGGLKGMVAGAAITGIINMAKYLADAADKAQDTAVAFGTTIDRIYAYNQAMVEAGGSTEVMDKAMQKLADTVDNAFEGNDAAVEAFQRLGISMESIKNQQLDKIFERVSKALEGETDAVKRNALAKELLGKSMINVDYATFNKAIESSAEKYANLRPHLEKAAELSDDLARIWKSFTTYLTAGVGVMAQIASDLAGAFGKIYDVVTGKKSLMEAITFTEVKETATQAAPAIERVAKATAAQTKAASDAAKEMDKLNQAIAKQVEAQISWESKLLDSINPMREIDRELVKLQEALDSGRISWEQYADGMFKITEGIGVLEQIKTPLDEIGVAIGDTLAQGVSGLVDSFVDAKKSFSDFASSFLTQIAKMIVQMTILQGIKKGLGGTSFGSMLGFAHGGSFGSGTGLPQGVYTQPTLFKFAHGGSFGSRMGVLGEAGAEAILPLRRDSSGDLGVKSSPINVQVNNNYAQGVDVEIHHTKTPEGIDMTIEINKVVKDALSNGSYDRVMQANYGVSRRGV